MAGLEVCSKMSQLSTGFGNHILISLPNGIPHIPYIGDYRNVAGQRPPDKLAIPNAENSFTGMGSGSKYANQYIFKIVEKKVIYNFNWTMIRNIC